MPTLQETDRDASAPSPADRDPWSTYEPRPEVPWNIRRVVHLHRRAGLAATWDEVQRDLRDGPAKSVDRLLAGKTSAPRTPPDFDSISKVLADAAVAAHDPARLKAWWFYRMLFGPDPLGERLTLMWHNHFATSNLKVSDLAAMCAQNELFRAKARRPFHELLGAAVRDPALLVWLDAAANRKEHPNENLGRELMELFTIGLVYTEGDVRDAARALTGWTIEEEAFQDIPSLHDVGEKTILGRKGRWRGDDLLKILLEHPGTARRLAGRLCQEFMGDNAVTTAHLDKLAAGLRARQLDVGWGVETIVRSEAFFAERNLGNRVLAPAEYIVGVVRALEMVDPPPSTLVLADWATRLGQDLFYPPNVFGWPGGRAWITTRSVIARANCAASLIGGIGVGRPEAFDALGFARRHGGGRDIEEALSFYGQLLLGYEPGTELRKRLHSAAASRAAAEVDRARQIVALMLASPEAQLC
jgi:uncharacterized protein (DUF1800 family)